MKKGKAGEFLLVEMNTPMTITPMKRLFLKTMLGVSIDADYLEELMNMCGIILGKVRKNT